MERARYIRCLRPTILLSILIFILTIFMPVDDANCETDRAFIEINSKYSDGPVVVPNLDYGEPGSSPHLRGITLPDSDGSDPSKEKISLASEASIKVKTWSYWFFTKYMLNQIFCGK